MLEVIDGGVRLCRYDTRRAPPPTTHQAAPLLILVQWAPGGVGGILYFADVDINLDNLLL